MATNADRRKWRQIRISADRRKWRQIRISAPSHCSSSFVQTSFAPDTLVQWISDLRRPWHVGYVTEGRRGTGNGGGGSRTGDRRRENHDSSAKGNRAEKITRCAKVSKVRNQLQEWSISNFSCSLTRNITSHSMKNLAFHSLLRWKMIILPILTTSRMHFCSKGWENVLFELRSERVKLVVLYHSIFNRSRLGPGDGDLFLKLLFSCFRVQSISKMFEEQMHLRMPEVRW